MDKQLSAAEVVSWRELDADQLYKALSTVNEAFKNKFKFDDIDTEARKELCDVFGKRFADSPSRLQQAIICCLRLIARDSFDIQNLFTDQISRIIIGSAQLNAVEHPFDWGVFVESEMCLINSLFHCSITREVFMETSCEKLISRIRLLNGEKKPDGITNATDEALLSLSAEEIDRISLYDLRIAFIITALSPQLQTRWVAEKCEKVFISVVENVAGKKEQLISQRRSEGPTPLADRAGEALKVLFNLFCHSKPEEVDKSSCVDTISVCAELITLQGIDSALEQAAVNVLATVPHPLSFLLQKGDADEVDKEDEASACDFTFVDAMLSSLDRHLLPDDHEEHELLGTYFTVLIYLCIQSKEARRHVRLKVMPPLRAEHVERRPDEGNTLRNKVIRVMMSPSNSRQLAAEFLFILCKRSANRLMKYCGFGNAAGLLANYGFLGAISQPKKESDSEDSETEDYKRVEPLVNPVTGCIEPEREIPQMSEEQKEYEAMQLVNAMSDLMDQGIISPGTVGDDGRLRPVKHVLELAEKNATHSEPEDESDLD